MSNGYLMRIVPMAIFVAFVRRFREEEDFRLEDLIHSKVFYHFRWNKDDSSPWSLSGFRIRVGKFISNFDTKKESDKEFSWHI